MAHPLDGYTEALSQRSQWIVYRLIDGEKLYHVGFGEYDTDRDGAIRYLVPPSGLSAELA